MARTNVLENFKPLVEETLSAILEDFRISESIAKQAGTLISKRNAKTALIPTQGDQSN
jgi:hypothetical protein